MIIVLFDILALFLLIYYIVMWRKFYRLSDEIENQWNTILKIDNLRFDIINKLDKDIVFKQSHDSTFSKAFNLGKTKKMEYYYKKIIDLCDKKNNDNYSICEQLRLTENRLLFECDHYNQLIKQLKLKISNPFFKLLFNMSGFALSGSIKLPQNDSIFLD